MHRLRILAAIAGGLIACVVLASAPPLPGTSAHAQKFAEARKKVERKGSAPKEPAKK